MRYVGFERLFLDKIIRNEKYNKMKKLEQIRLQQIRKGVKK